MTVNSSLKACLVLKYQIDGLRGFQILCIMGVFYKFLFYCWCRIFADEMISPQLMSSVWNYDLFPIAREDPLFYLKYKMKELQQRFSDNLVELLDM